MCEQPDPAAVFACALSLHASCLNASKSDPAINLSEAYQGGDQFMREMMRVANLFETWACEHVGFDALNDVWPYLLEDHFGRVCLEVMSAGSFGHFNEEDCLRVALKLRAPLKVNDALPIPICVQVENPQVGANFAWLRIQTARLEIGDEPSTCPYVDCDDPYDENFGFPFFGIYGVRESGGIEHIADRSSYVEAKSLLTALFPTLELPDQPISHGSR